MPEHEFFEGAFDSFDDLECLLVYKYQIIAFACEVNDDIDSCLVTVHFIIYFEI